MEEHSNSIPVDADALKKQREAQLSSDLLVTDGWIDAMHDPELGPVGRELKTAISASTLVEKADMDLRINAVFNSYAYPPKEGEKGLKNELLYGLPALDSKGVLLGARCHEFIHARQYQEATAAHANPFNTQTAFFLSPYDYVRLKEALEQDAYAKGAWLQNLVKSSDPDIAGALDRTPMPVSDFERIRTGSASLSEAFTKVSKAASDAQGRWLGDNSLSPARDLWHENALWEYAHVMGTRIKAGQTDFAFVRLTEKDLNEVGTAFGPDTYDGRLQPQLSPANTARVEMLEAMLKIRKRDQLPTIDEALAKESLSREKFREISQTHVGKKKEAPAP